MSIAFTSRLLLLMLLAQLLLSGAQTVAAQTDSQSPPTPASQQLKRDRKDQKTQRAQQKEADRQDAKNKKTALAPAPNAQKLPDSLRKHRSQKSQPAIAAESQKTVIKQGSSPDLKDNISPRLPPAQASHKILTTAQLLASIEDNLKKLSGVQLSSSQREMVNQIHSYVLQSKSAGNVGDLQRSQNLALKAHLLADELSRH